MYKKKFVVLLTVLMVFTMLFTACSSNSGSGSNGSNQPAQSSEPAQSLQPANQSNGNSDSSGDQAKKEGFHIALLDGTNQNPWRTQFEAKMKAKADEYKEKGLISKYDVFVAQNDPALQAQQMEQLINAGTDAIIINPVSATSLAPVIEKAVNKGILVLGVDQHINHPKVISVSNDQYEWARIQADWLAKQISGKGNILWFDALAGAPANDIRSKAFQDVLDKYPDIKVLKHVNADWDVGKAKQLMTQMISAFPNYDAILSQDGQPLGILTAIMEANAPFPKAITSDESVAYLKLWHKYNQEHPDNKMNAIIVENPPGIGVDTIMVAVRLLQGKKLEDGVLTSDAADPDNKNALLIKPTLVITNDNLEENYEKYKDQPDTAWIDNVLTEEDIDKYFQ